ncbi:LuxR C-terminal-related transcriptional regulator [Nocardia sp. CA-135398]|uniref:helix-turn-helix transcriptional regulator n=1 Tax=Nocardia sp. CA-135398 TaxID=3239977 RepID=UPI003D98702E
MSDAAVLPASDHAATLEELRKVIDGPLTDIARRFSRFLGGRWPHRALVIFTRECTGRPGKVAGAADIIDRITIAELEELKSSVGLGLSYAGEAALTGSRLWVWAIRDISGTLLVLVPHTSSRIPALKELGSVFGIVATSIRQQVVQSSPEYLAESRAASAARARTFAEMSAAHEAALARILLTLRSANLDDRAARSMATTAVSDALIALRSHEASHKALAEEAPGPAFARLGREISPLLHHQGVEAEFAAPPLDGRPIPGEVASGARAMTQAAVLALVTQHDLDRVRIAWEYADIDLVVDVRDRAGGQLDLQLVRQNLESRVAMLQADLQIESLPGWGSRVQIRIPLDPPRALPSPPELSLLNRREREVLALVAMGKRNKAIATELGVAESTVKFHVAGVLKKLEVSSRGEAAAIGMRAGLVPRPDMPFELER